jgi:hypothetical protein
MVIYSLKYYVQVLLIERQVSWLVYNMQCDWLFSMKPTSYMYTKLCTEMIWNPCNAIDGHQWSEVTVVLYLVNMIYKQVMCHVLIICVSSVMYIFVFILHNYNYMYMYHIFHSFLYHLQNHYFYWYTYKAIHNISLSDPVKF